MEYYTDTITKKRSIASIELADHEYEAGCITSHSRLDSLNTRLDSVEAQNKVISEKMIDSKKKVFRLSRSYSMGSINEALIDRLQHRVEFAETQSNAIYEKLAETEHKIASITPYISRSAPSSSSYSEEIDELISRIDDVELTHKEMREKLRNAQTKIGTLEQYSMKENIEIIGIPETVRHSELEQTVIKVLASINVNVTSSDIAVCHRLPKNSENGEKSGNVIVRFVDRKVSTDSLRKRKRLKKSPFNNIFNSTICIVENVSIL